MDDFLSTASPRAELAAAEKCTEMPLKGKRPALATLENVPLRTFTVDHELPEPDDHMAPPTATAASNVRMRIRDSEVLRCDQEAGFALGDEAEAEQEEGDKADKEPDADSHDAVKLNFFVHNGHR